MRARPSRDLARPAGLDEAVRGVTGHFAVERPSLQRRREMQRDERRETGAEERRRQRARRVLQHAERDVRDEQRVGEVDRHVQRLPHRRGEIRRARSRDWSPPSGRGSAEPRPPSCWKGNCARLVHRVLLTSRLTSALRSPRAWNWKSAKPPCARAKRNMVTPRWRRFHSSGRKRRSSRASGPIARTTCRSVNASVPKARMSSVSAVISGRRQSPTPTKTARKSAAPPHSTAS